MTTKKAAKAAIRAAETMEQGAESDDGNPGGNLFGGMGDDSYVIIHRRPPGGVTFAYCGKLSPAEATEEILRARGGGGTYRCKEMARDEGTGNVGFKRQRTLVIEGPAWTWRDPSIVDAASPAATVGKNGDGFDPATVTPQQLLTHGMIDLMKASRESSAAAVESQRSHAEATMKLIESVSRKGDGAAPAWLPAVLALLTPLVERMLAPKEAPPSMLETIRTLKELQAPAQDLGKQLETMEAYLGLKEMARDFGRPQSESTGDPLIDTVKESLPQILEVIRSGLAARAPAAPVPAPRPSTAVAPMAAHPLPAPAQGGPVWMLHLNRIRPALLKFAQQGKDADMVAEHLLEFMLPVEIRGDLLAFVSQGEQAATTFLGFATEFQPYADWVKLVMMGIYDQLTPESEVGGAVVGEGEGDGTGGEDLE